MAPEEKERIMPIKGPKKIPKYGYNFSRTIKETKFDTLVIARDLRAKVAKYVMNEKYVPKKWRFVDGIKAVDYAVEIRDSIALANDIKIGTDDADPDKVRERLDLQEYALSYCNILQLQLLAIQEDCDGANDNNMREVTDLLDDLIKRLTKWHDTDNARSGL